MDLSMPVTQAYWNCVINKQKVAAPLKPPAPLLLKACPEPTRVLKPEPMQLKGPLRSEADVLQHRRLYCGHYDQCLNESVYSGWAGFSCTRCPMRDQVVQSPSSEPFAHQRRSQNPNQ